MRQFLRFAAIDIGSNAVRLLFTDVFENGTFTQFKKSSLIRVPVRLGTDSFTRKNISDKTKDALLKTMMAFKYLLEVNQPVDYMACATSAMREARNGKDIVNEIKQQTGITVEIIDGEREAEIIFSNHIAESLSQLISYLYLDVGGGSTEVTLFSNNKRITSKSFNIGTVRMLENSVLESEWEKLKTWLSENTEQYGSIACIGSGGNINTVFKMSQKKEGTPLSFKDIKYTYELIKSYSYDDRIKILNLKSDRADVIIPALEIYLAIMKWIHSSKIYVPVIGLLDGIVHVLYEKYKNNNYKE